MLCGKESTCVAKAGERRWWSAGGLRQSEEVTMEMTEVQWPADKPFIAQPGWIDPLKWYDGVW
jgi:hypothetical protein